MAGCSDEVFDRDGEGVGYLRLELGQVDVELSSTTKAEAGSLPEGLVPEAADFTIDIRQGDTSVDGFPMDAAQFAFLLESYLKEEVGVSCDSPRIDGNNILFTITGTSL